MSKVFLGGTCNESTWRQKLIPLLTVDYFNPVVDDWTPECIEIENHEKENMCDIHLYVLTPAMTGVYSIAEVVTSSFNKNKKTIFAIFLDNNEFFEPGMMKSLKAVAKLIENNGASCITTNKIKKIANEINGVPNTVHSIEDVIQLDNKEMDQLVSLITGLKNSSPTTDWKITGSLLEMYDIEVSQNSVWDATINDYRNIGWIAASSGFEWIGREKDTALQAICRAFIVQHYLA